MMMKWEKKNIYVYSKRIKILIYIFLKISEFKIYTILKFINFFSKKF